MKKLQKILKYSSEPFVHLFVTIGFVIFTVCYEHAIKGSGENRSVDLNILLVVFLVLILLFLISTALSVITRFQDLEIEENKKKQAELEIEKIKAESNMKIEILKVELAKNNPVQVKFEQNYYKDGGRTLVDKAYITSLKEVSAAKKSIWIVADYSPPREPLIATEKRQEYYNVILQVLKNKIEAAEDNNIITYVRFMQRPDEIYKEIKTAPYINQANMIEGDEQAFAHCKKVLELANAKNKVEIKLYVTPIIPSLPSILIVDDHKMLFSIPKRKVNTVEETDKNLNPVETAGVINFTDNSPKGDKIVIPFQKIIKTLASDVFTDRGEKRRISRIDDFKENSEFQRWLNDESYPDLSE